MPLKKCDICHTDLTTIAYDAKTRQGPWGWMCKPCWIKYSVGHLGIGRGQKYEFDQRTKKYRQLKGGTQEGVLFP